MKKVLIIDDDPDILEAVVLMLTAYGYDTSGVQNGEEAYPTARSYQPDLIILDYLLSGIYGTDICKKLKEHDETRDIPIIMFSAHPEAREAVDICKARGFISKPFQVVDMIKKVEDLIGN